MLRQSFQILDKVKKRTENKIKSQGISDWNTFLCTQKIIGISKEKKIVYDKALEEAKKRFLKEDSNYFFDLLPTDQLWRLYSDFREEAVFLDIETSGVHSNSYISIIGLFDGYNTKTLVKGVNLDFRILEKELNKYKLIVTFNGSTFDIPMLKKQGIRITVPHFDLRHACNQAGLKGGLKSIEKELNIKRRDIIDKLYGGDPILLWRKFIVTGDDYFLKLLIEYNEEDTINLKKIADYVCKILRDS